MRREKQTAYLILVVVVMSLTVLACGTGYRTTKKITGNSGSVRVQIKEASGVKSTSVEINEDWTRQQVNATVNFSLEAGSCQASVLGEDSTAINLESSPGNPAQASGRLITNAFGDVTLETNCQGGQNLDLLINFER